MKTVYYSPFGGEVFAVVDGATGDADYEAALIAAGTKYKKESVADAKAAGPIAGAKFVGGKVSKE